MKNVYSDEEKALAEKERKKLLTLWFITLGCFFVIEVTMLVIHVVRVETMLDRAVQTPFMIISIVFALFYSFWSIAFLGIKYRYTKAYAVMYRDMREGLSDESVGTILSRSDELSEKDSVKFHSIRVECPPVRRGERNVRNLLIEENHEIPELLEGTKIRFKAHSGILLAYEIVSLEDKN